MTYRCHVLCGILMINDIPQYTSHKPLSRFYFRGALYTEKPMPFTIAKKREVLP